MFLLKLISKLKPNFKLLLIKFITILYLSCLALNTANASGVAYTIPAWCGSNPGEPCEPLFYTHMWVGTASNSTLFVPTIEVYYDTMVGYVGYKGSLTLGSNGNNCDYIGADRFCARIADINEHGNNFACDTVGNSCTYGSSTDGCETPSCNMDPVSGSSSTNVSSGNHSCTVGSTYYALDYANKYDVPYSCNNGGFYSLCCPGCRNICAMRICAYQDPSSQESVTEQCDDINSCQGTSSGYGGNPLMPYFENEVVAFKTIWGTETYYNTDEGTFIGCVEIPLGPYPPPYCDPIIGSIPVASTMDICQYSPQYELSQTTNDSGETGNYEQVSTSNNICELSTTAGIPNAAAPVYNVFGKPIVRLYFNNTLNLCSSNYQLPNPPPTPGNDTCVYLSTNLTPQEIWQDNESLIPVCSSDPGASTENCVLFPSSTSAAPGTNYGPTGSSTQLGSDYQYFRAYFNESGGTTPIFYGSDIASELSLYGINNSLYQDIGDQNLTYYNSSSSSSSSSSYSFKNEYGVTYDYGTVDISDYEGNTRTFGAFIDLGCDPYQNIGTTGDGDGTQLCIDEISQTSGVTPQGCFTRPWMFPPQVSSCVTYDSQGITANPSCSYDSSVNISQQPRIYVSVGSSSTYSDGKNELVDPKDGVIGVDILSNAAPVSFCVLDDNHTTAQQASNSATIPTPTNPCSQDTTQNNLSPCSIYQYKGFSAYITDNINYSISSDPNVINGTKTPYTTGQQYTGGMQYNDYIYCRGATKICLGGYDNTLKTVVTKMVNITTTTTNSDGSTTTTTTPVASTILTDRIIPPYVPGETYPLQNSQLYNPDVNNYYSGSSTTNTYIGYYDDTAGTYIQGQGCTTTSGMTCCATTQNITSSTVPSDSLCTPSGSIVYPSNVVCTCTNSLGESYICENSQCTTAYQETITTTTSGDTVTSTTSIDGDTVSTTTSTASSTSDLGNVTGYQIAGNQTTNTTTNSDGMPSPWTNCKYYSDTNITVCPATDDDGNILFTTRELTPMELGLCVDLLTPYCDAIDSTDGYTAANGYATWNLTEAGITATGTCTNGSKQSAAGPPQRACAYQDLTSSTKPSSNCAYTDPSSSSNTYPVLAANCCPEYTQAWGAVTNPCVVSPPWWPGAFLAGNANLQGAIINQFNVAYDYRSHVNSSKYLTPKSANVDPFNLYGSSNNTQYSSSSVTTTSTTTTPILPEPWNSCYSSYKKDGAGTAANYARTHIDGDQEMLYLTQNQWYDLWNNNNMEWLLASPNYSSNDGCYVYSLCTAFDSSGNCTAANINASFKGITPAMKICKYQDNISFALVDLGTYNSATQTYANPTDYTNDRYLMQSNIVAYNAYINNSGNVSVKNWCFSNDSHSTTNLSNNITDKTSDYDTRINNGIVVTRSGFGFTSANYDDSGALPTGFVQCNAEKCGTCTSGSCTYKESVEVGYNFDHWYYGSGSKGCTFGSCTTHTYCDYYNPNSTTSGAYPNNNSHSAGCSCDSGSDSYNSSYTKNTSTYYNTSYPLSIFSNNMTLSNTQSADLYLLNANNFLGSSYYVTPNFTSIYVPKGCSASQEGQSGVLSVLINSYTQGNSAANPAMFLWTSQTDYYVTNPAVSGYGAYGQPNQ